MSTDTAVDPTAASRLVIRPYAGEADIPDLVRVINAEYEADGVDERRTEEGERAWLSHVSEHFDPTRDVVLAELDGRVVAVAGLDWIDTRDGERREYRLWGAVEPAFRRRGIGSALLGHNERSALRLCAAQAPDRATAWTAFASTGRPGERLLQRNGYGIVRWFFDMVRPDLNGIVEPPMPEGLELRPVTADQREAIWRADREAFRDHWGGSDESQAAMRRFLEGPDADPSLWLIAWDGDEIAGGVINVIYAEENDALGIRRGWLDNVFTRRPWRRRGLAAALIGRSLTLLRERGMTSAALGVDAENATGALGLYEAAGFAVHDQFTAWRKPMEEPPT